ncbi:hypothetical protein Pla52o_53360 [Novipirellula galeiformis]|uniref:DUF5658 domain-containing protein n=1 Tax=Novipirellula galeiformis TaxID=2528004 RepID=A0A5C6BYC8_9BACT|nr:DUF5658 family protein [Novipirellula galeiformis]TWU17330.1 hypothetical protein Pla52o_53360 [Novipirellula galeiformis]
MTGIEPRNAVRFARLLIALLLGGLLSGGVHAQYPPHWSEPEDLEEPINTERMFVFVDGIYLAPPCQIEVAIEDAKIVINEQTYGADSFDFTTDTRMGSDPLHGGHYHSMEMHRIPGGKSEVVLRQFSRQLRARMYGAVLVLYSGETPMLLNSLREGHDLLKALIAKGTGHQDATAMLELASDDLDLELCNRLLADFEPTPDFIRRASELVEKQAMVEEANNRKAAALILGQQISYPLSIFAMIVVVFAFGHLISNPQQLAANHEDPRVVANAKKATIASLAILALLSLVDLIWTLIAHESGTMRELNPLGSGLIDRPAQLVLFKITLTTLSIGLLYWLHELPLARRATWWCCLVLTLLTARWLTFNSMFL